LAGACQQFARESPDVRGSTPWTPMGLEFVTPSRCQAIVIVVRRPPTTATDQDLRGRFAIDDVQLVELADVT